MAGFVGNQFCLPEPFVWCRIGREEESRVIVESRSGVLHAAELKAGKHHEIVLLKGIWNPREVLLPFDCKLHLMGDVRKLGYFRGIAFAVVRTDSLLRKILILKFPRCKCEQIGRQRPCRLESQDFSAACDIPFGLSLQFPYRLTVADCLQVFFLQNIVADSL